MTLARYLARAYPMWPDWALRATLKKKDVRINGVKSDASASVSPGDELTLYCPAEYLSGTVHVVFQENGLLVVEKPVRLPVDSDHDGIGADTLINRIQTTYPTARLCHRLDAGTGGIMLLALNDETEIKLKSAFEQHQIKKTYHCVARGQFEKKAGQLTHYLVKSKDAGAVRAYDSPKRGALTAKLNYHVLSQRNDLALVEVQLQTGRTHQIRVQFAHDGHPLLGDDRYGDRALNKAHKTTQPLLWCVKTEYDGQVFTSNAPFERESEIHGY